MRPIGANGVAIVCSRVGSCGDDSVGTDSVTLLTEWRRGSPKNLVGFLERPEDRVESLLAESVTSGGTVVAVPEALLVDHFLTYGAPIEWTTHDALPRVPLSMLKLLQ